MLIYNQINRLPERPLQRFAFGNNRQRADIYKMKALKPARNIKNTSLDASTSILDNTNKLKRLNKQNIEFLTKLGYKVLRK